MSLIRTMSKKQSNVREQLLRRVIALAIKLEKNASGKVFKRPLLIVGFGFLVRNRRIAEAIGRLGVQSAYEARMLLRTMIEIRINYAWLRLRQTYSRSLRFQRFWSIERLKLLEKAAAFFQPTDYLQRKAALEVERRKVRRLFRHRNSQGKLCWDRSWARVDSVEARLREVQLAASRENPDLFLYGLYVSFSSAVHGSPNSLSEVLQVSSRRFSALEQPESDPYRHYLGALTILLWSIEAFATDAKLKHKLQPELRNVIKALLQQRSSS